MEQLKNTSMNPIVGSAIGQGLGLINNMVQLSQSEKMQDLQIEGQKEITDYNLQKQMELWEKTNYKAQTDQMRKAGLNIGMMYSRGGQGGSTAITQGTVSGQQVNRNTENIQGMEIIQRMQTAQANIDLMKSQEKLNLVEAEKKATADTDLINTQIENLTQGIENQKTINELNEIEKSIKEIELEIDQRTKEIQITVDQEQKIHNPKEEHCDKYTSTHPNHKPQIFQNLVKNQHLYQL